MARKRNRQPGPIKRTIVTPTPDQPVARNLGLRAPARVAAPGPVRRARRAKLTDAQRDSQGKRSDWSRPAHLRPWTTPMTAAWSPTASTMPRGGLVDPTAYPTR
jgi:hypothetical protein